MMSNLYTIFNNFISNKLNISDQVSPQIIERIKRSQHMESVIQILACMTTTPLLIVPLPSQKSAFSIIYKYIM